MRGGDTGNVLVVWVKGGDVRRDCGGDEGGNVVMVVVVVAVEERGAVSSVRGGDEGGDGVDASKCGYCLSDTGGNESAILQVMAILT